MLDLGVTTSYGANSVNAYHSISGSAAPVHDDNGNMTSGPVNGSVASGMVYGKENNNLLSASGTQATNFVYDAMGRLVQFSYTENSVTKTEILTWAGWTLMTREIFTGNTVSETFRYTWGSDLSGTMEGAGGVGGLLAVERNVAGSNTWDIRYTHTDANGNIIALTNSSGAVSARYRYDVFGKVLSATDVDASGWVNHNIHGFSSKPSFGNQGLLYYGYRWYSPSLGRWINRDPIEEKGGMNLYGFVGNDGVEKVDVLGLFWPPGSNPYPGVFPLPKPPSLPRTPDSVAVQAGRDFREATNRDKTEYCGKICKNLITGFIWYTHVQGTEGSCKPGKAPCPLCNTELASWHTHPLADIDGDGTDEYEPESFSPADIRYAEFNDKPIYVNTPGGLDLKYDPGTDKTIDLTYFP